MQEVKRKVIKIGVLRSYGLDNMTLIEECLRCENTEEKLKAIKNITLTWNLDYATSEQALFVIQKLLSYPKKVRLSIANQLRRLLEDEAKQILNTYIKLGEVWK